MRTKLAVLMVICLALSFAHAQDFFNPFGIGSTSKATQPQIIDGSWAKYHTDEINDNEEGDFQISIVGMEKCGTTNCTWFEMEFWKKSGDHDIMKYLVKGTLDKGSGTFSIITKHNDEQATELIFDIPEDTTRKDETQTVEKTNTNIEDFQPTSFSDDEGEWKMDKQTITVPAGTFECIHTTYIKKDTKEKAEIWHSTKVPVTGLVKMKSADGEMKLLAYGTSGAKSAITEKPKQIRMNSFLQDAAKEAAKESAKDAAKEGVKDGVKGALKGLFGK